MVPIAPTAPGALKTISAASYAGTAVAPESIAATFGAKLAAGVVSNTSATLSQTLGGTTLTVEDSAGVNRLGRLYFVSPGQINFEVPAATAVGDATVTAYAGSGLVSTAKVAIKNATPGIFTANGNGSGVPAALGLRVTPAGVQSPVNVFQCNASGVCSPAPIAMGADRIFIELYGTGARKRTSLENVTCTIGGVAAPVAFVGAQGVIGLDQINIEVPASLRGRGEVQLVLTVDGEAANSVTLNIQ